MSKTNTIKIDADLKSFNKGFEDAHKKLSALYNKPLALKIDDKNALTAFKLIDKEFDRLQKRSKKLGEDLAALNRLQRDLGGNGGTGASSGGGGRGGTVSIGGRFESGSFGGGIGQISQIYNTIKEAVSFASANARERLQLKGLGVSKSDAVKAQMFGYYDAQENLKQAYGLSRATGITRDIPGVLNYTQRLGITTGMDVDEITGMAGNYRNAGVKGTRSLTMIKELYTNATAAGFEKARIPDLLKNISAYTGSMAANRPVNVGAITSGVMDIARGSETYRNSPQLALNTYQLLDKAAGSGVLNPFIKMAAMNRLKAEGKKIDPFDIQGRASEGLSGSLGFGTQNFRDAMVLFKNAFPDLNQRATLLQQSGFTYGNATQYLKDFESGKQTLAKDREMLASSQVSKSDNELLSDIDTQLVALNSSVSKIAGVLGIVSTLSGGAKDALIGATNPIMGNLATVESLSNAYGEYRKDRPIASTLFSGAAGGFTSMIGFGGGNGGSRGGNRGSSGIGTTTSTVSPSNNRWDIRTRNANRNKNYHFLQDAAKQLGASQETVDQVDALFWNESGWDPTALGTDASGHIRYNSKGESLYGVGLGQSIKGTGEKYGLMSMNDRLDPAKNSKAMLKYWMDIISRLRARGVPEGELLKAAAAEYTGGSGGTAHQDNIVQSFNDIVRTGNRPGLQPTMSPGGEAFDNSSIKTFERVLQTTSEMLGNVVGRRANSTIPLLKSEISDRGETQMSGMGNL